MKGAQVQFPPWRTKVLGKKKKPFDDSWTYWLLLVFVHSFPALCLYKHMYGSYEKVMGNVMVWLL